MTLFLATVIDAAEGETVIAAGADVVDLARPCKDGSDALDTEDLRSACKALHGRVPLAASAGRIPMEPGRLAHRVGALAALGLDYVRVALSAGPSLPATIDALAPHAASVRLIAILEPGLGDDRALLELIAKHGFAAAMLGACGAASALSGRDTMAQQRFVAYCRSAGLAAGFGGALEPPDIPRLLPLRPDMLQIGEALRFAGEPERGLDIAAVSAMRALIPAEATASPAASLDPDDLEEAGRPAGPTTDIVFVHDLVLAAQIGAYRGELGARQRVRFTVEASITRASHMPRDMRDVLSYDIIVDGIRRIVGEGHVAFVETLAERIAALVLGQSRVMAVMVRVEKLDVGEAVVGVEIRRQRPPRAGLSGHAERIESK